MRTPLERGLAWGQLKCLQLKESEILSVESQSEEGSAGEGSTAEDRRRRILIVQTEVKTEDGRRKVLSGLCEDGVGGGAGSQEPRT